MGRTASRAIDARDVIAAADGEDVEYGPFIIDRSAEAASTTAALGPRAMNAQG